MAGKAMDAWWAEQDKGAAYECNQFEQNYPRALKTLERAKAAYDVDPSGKNLQVLWTAQKEADALKTVGNDAIIRRLIARVADLEKRLEVNDGR